MTADAFNLPKYIVRMRAALDAVSAEAFENKNKNPRLIWSSGFDGMNSVSRCIDTMLGPQGHVQRFGAEANESAAAFNLRCSRPGHLFKDRLLSDCCMAQFKLRGVVSELTYIGASGELSHSRPSVTVAKSMVSVLNSVFAGRRNDRQAGRLLLCAWKQVVQMVSSHCSCMQQASSARPTVSDRTSAGRSAR